MTPRIKEHINARVKNYLSGDNPNPVTLQALYGPGWDDIPARKRATLGNWFGWKVRQGEFPGLRTADPDELNVKRYEKA